MTIRYTIALLLFVFSSFAWGQRETSHLQLEMITGFEIPDTRDVFGEVVESHHNIKELFDEFITDKKANKVTLYEYNNTGKISIIRYFSSEDFYKQRKPDHQYIFEYGKGNQLSRYYNQGPPNIRKTMTALNYDTKGRIISLKRYSNNEGTPTYGKLTSTVIVDYDSIGNITRKKESFEVNGVRSIETKYEYDINGSLVKSSSYETTPQGGLVLVNASDYNYANGIKKRETSYGSQAIDSITPVMRNIEGLIRQKDQSFEYTPGGKGWLSRSIYENRTIEQGYSVKKPVRVIKRSYLSPEARAKKVKAFEDNRRRIIQERKEKELAEQTRALNEQKRSQLSVINESIDRLYVVKDFSKPANTKAHTKYVKKHLYIAYMEIYKAKKDSVAFYDRLLYIQNSMLQLFDKKTQVLEKSLKKAKSLDQKIELLLPKKQSQEDKAQATN